MSKKGPAKSAYYKKLFNKNYDLISATYHEAGHAISGLLNFIKIIVVEAKIYSDNKVGGYICFDGFTFDPEYDNCIILNKNNMSADFKRTILLGEIKLNYAGIVAEKLLLKKCSGADISPFFLKWGAGDDISGAAELIKKFNLAPPGRKRYSFKQKMFKETAKELDLHWDAVTTVAHLLYKNKQINYNDLKTALCTKLKNKKFWVAQFKKIDKIFNNKLKLDENGIKSIIFA